LNYICIVYLKSAPFTSKYYPIEDRRKRSLSQKKSKLMGVNNMKILIAEDDRDIALMYRLVQTGVNRCYN
jgi:hypothetical protein